MNEVADNRIPLIPAINVRSFTLAEAPKDVIAALLTMDHGEPARDTPNAATIAAFAEPRWLDSVRSRTFWAAFWRGMTP